MPAESSAAPETDLTQPATTFAALGVPAPLVEVLEDEGITMPFPVQAATLPDALAGRDILGRARTGSGKTLGFSLPLVSRLAGGSTLSARPRGLVLVPTRELATQVTTVLKPLARAMDLWVTTIYGGVSYGPQINALQRRTDIVVATPGRLADLIGQGECDLSDVEVTVIDEADQMADLGFLPIVRRLLETTPDDGQRMLFSATLDAAIDVLARRFLNDPVLHSVDENSSPAEIEHHVITVEPTQKVAVVAALTGGEKRSLVFTRTKHGAERLARQLTDAGIPAAELHGNLRQGARSRNLAAFTDGIARVMVATDIAARGIHVDGIDLVIHADPPAEHKAYVHRSGRTARGGADGVVVTLQTKSQARDVTAMMRKADITPHTAVTANAESDVLTEIAGPPAPRVTVTGKVAELVKPEDRLSRNDRPGAGASGRPRRNRDRDRDRDRRPRDDRFRDSKPRGFAPRDRDGWANHDGAARRRGSDATAPTEREDAGHQRPASLAERPADGRPDRRERPARSVRFERDDRPSRFAGDDRPSRFERDDRPARGERFERDNRSPRFERADGSPRSGPADRPAHGQRPGDHDRGARFERPGRFDRPARGGDGNSRFDRGDRGDRGARFDRGDRPDRFQRGDQQSGDRRFDDRPASNDRGYSDRPARRDDRSGNDWWPRSGGRQAPGGYGRPGYRSDRDRPFGGNGPSRDSRPSDRSFRDDRPARDDRPFRDDRPARNDRPSRGERPAGDERSGRDERPFRGERPAWPQSGGRSAGGHFGGSSRRSGYSAGRGTAGKRRDSGQGRHF